MLFLFAVDGMNALQSTVAALEKNRFHLVASRLRVDLCERDMLKDLRVRESVISRDPGLWFL